MGEKPAVYQIDDKTIEQVVVGGDLAALTSAQRVSYYQAVCSSLGLNPLTKPFDYIRLNNRLTLYARKDATDQLRKRDKISIEPPLQKELIGDTYIVTATASTPDGRRDLATGVVSTKGLTGDALANAMMKAETKAKRRVTLSICGLGWLDEAEIETTDAEPVQVDETGQIKDASIESPKTWAQRTPQGTSRPWPPELVRAKLLTTSKRFGRKDKLASAEMRGLLVGKMQEALQTKDDKLRHLGTKWIWGVENSGNLTYSEINATLKWLVPKGKDDATGDYLLDPMAIQELLAICRQAQIEAGQLEMPDAQQDIADLYGDEAMLSEEAVKEATA